MKYFFTLATILALCGCDPLSGPGKADTKPPTTEATQLAIQKMIIEQNIFTAKSMKEVQLAVVKGCMDKGMVPVFINNNVDCKAVK